MQTNPILADPLCRPKTASKFRVENQIYVNGFHLDIRRFSWEQSWDGTFEADAYYIDYSLGPRVRETHFIHPDPPGETVFLPKGSRFKAHCSPSAHRLLCLTFDHERAVQLFEGDDLTSDLPPCLNLREPRVRRALARLAEEVQNPGFAQHVLVESVALLLVVDLCRHFRKRQISSENMNGRIAAWRLKRLQDCVYQSLGAELSLARLAAECGMSPRHLNRTFKATVGKTLSDYIAEVRVAEAKRQLAQRDTPIKVIAGKCGFQNASAFSASFHKNTGLTPMQFRDTQLRFTSECRE